MPRRPTLPFSSALAAVLAFSGAVAGQSPLILELRGGAAVPVGSLSEGAQAVGEASGGAAFGLDFSVRRSDHLGLFGGFTQLRFDCSGGGPSRCSESGEVVATSWDLGARVHLAPGNWGPWARLGILLARVEGVLERAGGPERVSDLGVGGEVGLGYRIGMTDRLGLSPGIRFVMLNSRLPESGLLRLRYWVADLGLVIGF